MDKKNLNAAIIVAVKQAMLTFGEKWVTAEQLCEHVGTLTPRLSANLPCCVCVVLKVSELHSGLIWVDMMMMKAIFFLN